MLGGCFIVFVIGIDGLYGDAVYGIAGSDGNVGQTSLVEYNLINGNTKTIIPSTAGIRSNVGESCYDVVFNRYYYLYSNISTLYTNIEIWRYDLNKNASLNSIDLSQYFQKSYNPENYPNLILSTFLLFCNPNNGDLYVFGTSKSNMQDQQLYNLKFSINGSYDIKLIATYSNMNTEFSASDSYIDQPRVFDSKRNTIWFCYYQYQLKYTYYNIDVLNGTILQTKTHSNVWNPYRYLDYLPSQDKIVGGLYEFSPNFQLEIQLFDPIDLSPSNNAKVVDNLFICAEDEYGIVDGISTIDVDNDIWYIFHNIPFMGTNCANNGISVINITNNQLLSTSERVCLQSNDERCSYGMAFV